MSQKTEGDVFRALTAFLLTAEEPIAFLRRWNEGSFDICRKEWPEAPEDLYPPAPAAVAVPDDLKARCAEILDWQWTGILTGNALRDFAAAHYSEHHDALQMAERTTAREAYAALAADPAQEHATQLAGQGLADAEQRAFEDWLARERPSGDAESVQYQWTQSADYADFHDEAAQAREDARDAEVLMGYMHPGAFHPYQYKRWQEGNTVAVRLNGWKNEQLQVPVYAKQSAIDAARAEQGE